MAQLFTAGLVLLKDRKLLLCFSRNKVAWYLRGGKIHAGESPVQALIRELVEELNVRLPASDLVFYTHISAQAYGEPNGTLMEQDCFRCDWEGTILPSSEIERAEYFDIASFTKLMVRVPGVLILMEKLIVDGFMDPFYRII